LEEKSIIGKTAKFGNETDNTTIEADGTIKFNGAATVWDDVLPTIANANTGGAAPNMTLMGSSGTIRAQEFANISASEEFQACWQLPHSWKEGSTITPHLHLYIPDDGTGGVIQFQMIYTWQNVNNGTMTETTVLGSVTRTANQGIDGNTILSFGDVVGTGKTISSLFSARIMRVQGGVDTFGGTTWLRSADIHIEKDTIGSRTATAK
jgi:hypothetical protein